MSKAIMLQSQELEVLLEVAKAIEEWPVYYTSNAEVATALGLTACSSYIVGTRFDLNKGAFVSVSSEGHEAFEEDRSLKESLLRFLKTEQLPPYLPYSSTTNQRVFAMDRQVREWKQCRAFQAEPVGKASVLQECL